MPAVVEPCPELESVSNGRIIYEPDNAPNLFFGTTATYVCNLGFGLTGSMVRSCVADTDTFNATWTGNSANCAGG